MTEGYQSVAPALTRLALAWVFYRFALPRTFPNTGLISPVGLARVLDLSLLAHPGLYRSLRGIALLALVAYSLGLAPHLALSYLCLHLLLYQTVLNSMGAISHRNQMLSLVLLAQAASPLIAGSEAFFWSQQAIVSVYFTAGLTKLWKSGRRWFHNAPLVALQLVKGARQFHHSKGTFERSDESRATANWLLAHPNLTRFGLAWGLVLELCSPLFLMGSSWAALGGIALLVFHAVIWRTMRIHFLCNCYLVAIFLIDVPSFVGGR